MTTLTIMRTLPREVYLVFKNHLPFSLEHFCRTFYCRSNFFKQKSMIWDLKLLFSPLQVDPVVYNMLHEDPGNVSYSAVGGLSDQIRELRESIELPLMNPELFLRVGIKPPKVNPTLFVLRSLIVHVMWLWDHRDIYMDIATMEVIIFYFTHCRVFYSMVHQELVRHYWRGLLPVTSMPTFWRCVVCSLNR